MAIRALIFDFDGLILDTETPSLRTWQELYREHGCILPDHLYHQRIGAAVGAIDLYQHLQQLVGRTLDLDTIRLNKRQRSTLLIESLPPQPGIQDCLASAQELGLRLGVASSSPHNWVDTHLRRLKLDHYFDTVCCAEDVGASKPDPATYVGALAALGARPDEAIAFEDSPNGIQAARAARLYCIAIPNDITRHLDLSQAHRLLPSLQDISLPHLLQQAITARL